MTLNTQSTLKKRCLLLAPFHLDTTVVRADQTLDLITGTRPQLPRTHQRGVHPMQRALPYTHDLVYYLLPLFTLNVEKQQKGIRPFGTSG